MKELKIENNIRPSLVDDEDYERLLKFLWFSRFKNTGLPSEKDQTNGNAITRNYFRFNRKIHISIASEIMNQPFNMYDHKDRNSFNNQKSNLRECTVSQNGMNRTKQANTLSKYKGVSWHKRDKRWVGSICIEKKCIHLGYFKREEDAALAYNEAAIRLFKEFANLNIIQ